MATTKKSIRARATKAPQAEHQDLPEEVMGKTYASVSDLVRDTCDADFADEFDRHLAEHRMSKILTVIRCNKGLTQGDVGDKIGCGQAKVSKMERTPDLDLNFGDIIRYAYSLGQSMHVVFMPSSTSAVDHIRFHMNSIKHELGRLVQLAGDDRAIGDGIEAYAIYNVEKYIAMIDDTLNKLPHREQKDRSPMCVEVEGERGERLPLDVPKRVRKASRKPVSTS